MKISTFFFLFITAFTLSAQVPSDCTIPSVLRDIYDRDVKGLAIKRMQAQNSPDNALIAIPDAVQDSIYEGMAAILNVMDQVMEGDSVFNLYCVHDNWDSPAVFGMIIGVDSDSPMATAWESGTATTGIAAIDNLISDQGFVLQNYFSFGAGVFYSNDIWNIFAIADSLTNSVEGVEYVEPDYLIGGAGRIGYNTDESGKRYYEFRHEWNDCFDGCDNFYTWNFVVDPDCLVTFTGSSQGGVFGNEPLPDPVNCLLFTSTDGITPEYPVTLYPNPAQDFIYWEATSQESQWQLYNSLGQLIRTGDWQETEVNISQLSTGTYWLILTDRSGKKIGQQAFVKQ